MPGQLNYSSPMTSSTEQNRRRNRGTGKTVHRRVIQDDRNGIEYAAIWVWCRDLCCWIRRDDESEISLSNWARIGRQNLRVVQAVAAIHVRKEVDQE